MRDKVFSSAGAQEGLDTSGYQVSADLDDVEFYWEENELDVDAVFRPGIHTPFSPTAFDDLEMGGSAENPVLLDKEGDRKTLLQLQQKPVSERLTRSPALLRSRVVHLEHEQTKFLIMFIEICFNRYHRVCVLI